MSGESHGVVKGQAVTPEKVARAKQLRQEMTEAERVLWRWLRSGRANGARFRRQQVIDGFIIDFYCHSHRLVVEVDGESHQDQEQMDYDRERDRILTTRGLLVLRVTNGDVLGNTEAVVSRIKMAMNHAR